MKEMYFLLNYFENTYISFNFIKGCSADQKSKKNVEFWCSKENFELGIICWVIAIEFTFYEFPRSHNLDLFDFLSIQLYYAFINFIKPTIV